MNDKNIYELCLYKHWLLNNLTTFTLIIERKLQTRQFALKQNKLKINHILIISSVITTSGTGSFKIELFLNIATMLNII